MSIVDSKMIPFNLIEQKEETTNLLIVLPGAGYTTQAPLLRFTTGIYYNKGFDVLHINYTFGRQRLSDLSEEDFTKNIQLVIDHAIKNKKYHNYYIVAKSIGTLALSYLLNQPMFKDAKVIWLTPLLQREVVYTEMVHSNHEGLCIIGDKDPCFIAERFESLTENPNLICKVVDGGNHSLELDEDPIKSIEILKSVMIDISEF